MSKNVIHNFDIKIENSTVINSSEDLKNDFIKELAKVSKEMSQQKDIEQLWQEYKNQETAILNNSSTSAEEGVFGMPSGVSKNPLLSNNTTSSAIEGIIQNPAVSGLSFFTAPIEGGASDTTGRISMDSYTSDSITPSVMGVENNELTSQIYSGIASQQSVSIPSRILTDSDEIKSKLKKNLNADFTGDGIDLMTFNSKDFSIEKKEQHFAEQTNSQTERKRNNLSEISETSINNISWEKLSGLMIFKLSELWKEENDIYLKEYYDFLIRRIKTSNVNIQQLFLENDELFILLKSIFPSLPEKITIHKQKNVYPDLGSHNMYPEIGVENIYFKAYRISRDNLKYQFKLKEEHKTIQSIDSFVKDPIEPLHHQFLISTAIKIYNAAKSKDASGKGALLIMAQASIESGYGKDAMRRGDYNLFGTSTSGNDFKVKNSQIKIKDYSDIGGYDASIKDYFDKKLVRWTGIANLIKNKNFTADDIDKAFYTGVYIEDEKTRNKTGHGAYNFDHVETSKSGGRGTIISNNNKYGELLIKQMADFKKRLIGSIDFQIKKNEKEIIEIEKKDDSKNNINASVSILMEANKSFSDLLVENLENENRKLIEIKKDIEN